MAVTFEPVAKDGRALATETHGDITVQYLWDKSIDADAVYAARAVEIAQEQQAQAQADADRKVAEKQVASVLDVAVKAGTLDDETIRKAGYEKPSEVLKAEAVGAVRG